MKRYCFIGLGNMGGALLRGMLEKRILTVDDVLVVEKIQPRLDIAYTSQITADIGEYEAVVLAVKPQQFNALSHDLEKVLNSQQLIISIMAGVNVRSLSTGLGNDNIVRVMPNLPAQANCGASVFYSAKILDNRQQQLLKDLFEATGILISTPDEQGIDKATAISGSGPGYMFYWLEHWYEQALQFGFSKAEASQLVQQTALGAVKLWQLEKGTHPQELRQRVCSKGGTTTAAITVFDAEKMGDTLREGIKAALKRSLELSQGD